MILHLALAQMDVTAGRPEENMQRVEALARETARSSWSGDPAPHEENAARLLLLPELWLSGYDLAHAEEHAQSFESDFRARWTALAHSTGLYIAGSVLALDPGSRPANTALLLSPQGQMLATYRKVHRFGPMGETRYLAPGDATPYFDLPWGRTALAICYDLRFPEIFRRYTLEGVILVLLLAQWPDARVEHWRILLRARAIENQYFLAACNRVGRDPDGTGFGGHSAVIGPWGKVIVEGGEERALLLANLDLEEVAQIRQEFPVLQDRREEIYRYP